MEAEDEVYRRALRGQAVGANAEAGGLVDVVAHGVGGVADLGAGAAVQADATTGFPDGNIGQVAAKAELNTLSPRIFQKLRKGHRFRAPGPVHKPPANDISPR